VKKLSLSAPVLVKSVARYSCKSDIDRVLIGWTFGAIFVPVKSLIVNGKMVGATGLEPVAFCV
jgi:hypothetical protein